MIVYTISLDTSGGDADGRALRNEVDAKLGGVGDPCDLLIWLETIAENQLRHTRDLITDDQEFINSFIKRHIY